MQRDRNIITSKHHQPIDPIDSKALGHLGHLGQLSTSVFALNRTRSFQTLTIGLWRWTPAIDNLCILTCILLYHFNINKLWAPSERPWKIYNLSFSTFKIEPGSLVWKWAVFNIARWHYTGFPWVPCLFLLCLRLRWNVHARWCQMMRHKHSINIYTESAFVGKGKTPSEDIWFCTGILMDSCEQQCPFITLKPGDLLKRAVWCTYIHAQGIPGPRRSLAV